MISVAIGPDFLHKDWLRYELLCLEHEKRLAVQYFDDMRAHVEVTPSQRTLHRLKHLRASLYKLGCHHSLPPFFEELLNSQPNDY